MRTSLKKHKPKAPTILQQQSSKLKQKLQLLRNQVTQKKLQKQMNKTATSLQSSNKLLTQTQKSNKLLSQTTKITTSQFNDLKFINLLTQINMENLLDKFKQKGIKTYDKFIQLNQQQIDQWKDVAVGWRIKIKKSLRNLKSKQPPNQLDNQNTQSQTNFNKINTSQTNFNKKPTKQQPEIIQNSKQEAKQRRIQDIIKQRKQIQLFIPINRQMEQFDEDQFQDEMTQQDQDVIIKSFMKVFQPRTGILTKQSKKFNKNKQQKQNNQSKKVSWSKSVQQMQRQYMQKNHKKYPKQSIVKEALIIKGEQQKMLQSERDNKQNMSTGQRIYLNNRQTNSKQEIKYCWQCFRKIQLKHNISYRIAQINKEKRYLCSEKCQQLYTNEFHNFNHTQNEDREGLVPDKSQQKLQYSNQQWYEEDLQVIDLQIL